MREGTVLAASMCEEKTVSSSEKRGKELRDQILQRLNRVQRACAPDLANELKTEATPEELLLILKSLAEEGLVREVPPDPKDTRNYKKPYQTRYEIAV
jgi:hypothetical protein